MIGDKLQFEINDSAEGSPSNPEGNEPIIPPITNPSLPLHMPVRRPRAAETGLMRIVDLGAEGRDNGDIQDASRTRDETDPAIEQEAVKIMDKAPTVLIVEDTLELAEVIQATLERMELATVHASHGSTALEKLRDLNPEIVLLDIALPDITGWKIMDVLKERLEETNGQMPVIIVITAYDDPANRLIGKLQGVFSYLVKPFTSDEIERIVSLAINSRAL